MTNCKHMTNERTCGLKSNAYRHRCYGEDKCRLPPRPQQRPGEHRYKQSRQHPCYHEPSARQVPQLDNSQSLHTGNGSRRS